MSQINRPMQLTAWSLPNEIVPSATDPHQTYKQYLDAEATRIGALPGRWATVERQGVCLALWVNRVADNVKEVTAP